MQVLHWGGPMRPLVDSNASRGNDLLKAGDRLASRFLA